MELVRLDDAVAFRRLADPLLLENEAANNLALGVSAVAASTTTYEEFHGWVVRTEGHVVAAAVQTPPHNLILAVPLDPLAVQFLADSLGALPGVIGNVPAIDVFVEARPEDARQTMRQGVFKLSRVSPPTGPGLPAPCLRCRPRPADRPADSLSGGSGGACRPGRGGAAGGASSLRSSG
ncbi:MAG: hypothetical protein WCE80_05080 [Acidimicrobiia bacterium]